MKIHIERLSDGKVQKIDEVFDPSFLGPNEAELKFSSKVHVLGEAYVTDAHLILHLKAKTHMEMPCAICNQMIQVELKVNDFYFTQPVQEIPSSLFNYGDVLREALLIELPKTVECKENCPERTSIQAFLRGSEHPHYPFHDLN